MQHIILISSLVPEPATPSQPRGLVRSDVYAYDVLTHESTEADIVVHLARKTRKHFNNYSEVARLNGLIVVKGLRGLW